MRLVQAGLLALLLFCCGAPAFADVAVPALTGRVVDQTGTLSSSEQSELSGKLADFEKRKGSQIGVLIVPTTEPETIAQFSIRVAEAWKLGRSKVDDGAILLVAKNDRKLRIEVGNGLEGALTDATTRRIIDEIIAPRFKTGDFAGGIKAGAERMMKIIDGEPLSPPPEPSEWRADTALFDQLFEYAPFLLFGAFIGGAFLRQMLGRLLGSLVAGGLVMAAVWLIVSSVIAGAICGLAAFFITLIGDSALSTGGSSGRSGSSGGGWSSGSSSSSSSSGGFSGGGGSFSGGGASGSW
ncbi:YgcG family protein [Tardiphaga alba]|uniref:YgcG family protein n=1 Tax=Tardiphaga alba TaxID=340268 RepID=A0ABX8A5S4_9BRAD|nr:TPM domain-containing protein [Tardiphaga alba]QUS38762.1 YgcG family protein [Tardiphaga alba]